MRYILLVLLAFVTTFASAQVQYLGSPTTTVRNRGNFVSDSLFYLPKRQKLPSDTGALRYQISDSALYVWTGSAWRSTGTAGSAITGSGVAGYMPKFTTTTNIANSNIYNSSGRVAINHTSPANPLHIYSDTASEVLRLEYKNTAPYISFYQKTTRLGYLQFDSAFGGLIQDETNMPLRFATSGTERMRLKADGELLLNTTSDAGNYQLQVAGSIYNTTGAVLAASSGNVGIGVTNPGYKLDLGPSNDAYARIWFSNLGFIGSGNDVAGFQIRTLSSTTNGIRFTNYAANQEYARFNTDGELLIGTTTDAGAYALQVAGAGYFSGSLSTTGQLRLEQSASGSIVVGSRSAQTDFQLYNTSNVFRIFNGAIDALAINTSGYVGIGTITPQRALVVDGKAVGGVIQITNNTAGNVAGTGLELVSSGLDVAISGKNNGYMILATNNTERIRIQADGEVLVGTASDAGAYALQVAGSIYNTTGAVLAASSGNVGIGTTSPGANLDVSIQGTQGSGQNTRTIRISGAGDDASVLEFFNAWTGNAFVRAKITSDGDATSQAYGTLKFFTTQNSSLGTTERMRISSGGNVGIGTTTPSQPLHVNGNILTAAPSGGTAKPFKIGEAATVSPTSPNRTIRVEIDGTVYYIHAKTTND